MAANDITVLRLTEGAGRARLLRHDHARGALLLDRLDRSLHQLAPPIGQRHEILCATAARLRRRGCRAAACPPARRKPERRTGLSCGGTRRAQRAAPAGDVGGSQSRCRAGCARRV